MAIYLKKIKVDHGSCVDSRSGRVCYYFYIFCRDINASINIKNAGINILKEKGINLLKNSTGLMPESYALRDMSEEVNNSAQESIAFRLW
jgi:hypothetical protein